MACIVHGLTSVAQEGVVPADGDALFSGETSMTGLRLSAALEFYSHDVWHGMVGYGRPLFKTLAGVEYETGDYGTFFFSPEMLLQAGTLREKNAGGISEVDYIAEWNRDFGPLGVTLGHVFYTFPAERAENMHESLFGLSYETPFFTPFVTVCYDYNQSRSLYFSGGLLREFKLADAWTLETEVNVGYGTSRYCRHYFDVDRAAVTDGTARLSLIYDVLPNPFSRGDASVLHHKHYSKPEKRFLYLGLTVAYSTLLDSGVRNGPVTRESTASLDAVWYGLLIGIEL